MGNFRPIKVKCFIKYLESLGCYKAKQQPKGSHSKYKCPGAKRSIMIRENEKMIPPLHIKTNASTLGVTIQDVYDWVEKNC